ncbi:MAG: hypothetical protein WC821_02535 [archaeon]|jgi:ribosomal protein L31E
MAKDFKEKIITINLKRAFEKPVTKRAIGAKFALKAGVEKETRLHKQLISNKLNEFLWARGKYNAPRKITVKVVKDKDTARIMLPEEKYEPKAEKKKETKGNAKEEIKASEKKAEPQKEQAPKAVQAEEKKTAKKE